MRAVTVFWLNKFYSLEPFFCFYSPTAYWAYVKILAHNSLLQGILQVELPVWYISILLVKFPPCLIFAGAVGFRFGLETLVNRMFTDMITRGSLKCTRMFVILLFNEKSFLSQVSRALQYVELSAPGQRGQAWLDVQGSRRVSTGQRFLGRPHRGRNSK